MRAIATIPLLSLLSAGVALAAPPAPAERDNRKAEDPVGGKPKEKGAANNGAAVQNERAPKCSLATVLDQGLCPSAPPTENKAAVVRSGTEVLQNLADRKRLAPSSVGAAQGLALDALNEAVQILGQIVVDRASQEAFRQLQEKLVKLLDCAGGGKTILPMTCEAIQTLRLQDIASSPQVLSSALLADIAAQLFALTNKALAANVTATQLLSIIQRDIAPILFRGDHGIDTRMAPLSVSKLRAQGLDFVRAAGAAPTPPVLCAPTTNPGRADAALGFAAAATTACFLQQEDAPANCPGADVVATLFDKVCGATGDRAIEKAAETLAIDLITAATAVNDKSAPDGKRRLRAANDGLWDYLCLSVDFTSGCPVTAQPPTAQWALGSLRAVFGSAIEGDKLETVVRTATLMRALIQAPEEQSNRQRGLRLLAGLLDYTVTFDPAKMTAPPGSTTPPPTQADLHAQRTKILESLTADMTDRTGRLGDNIFSVGGALRATGGVWLRDSRAFYGPVSLPLGFALDSYFKGKAHGFHFEVTAIDLGQYLTFDNGGEVRTPDAVQAFAPGAGIAFFWGTSIPFTLGVNASYSPTYRPTETASRGAFNIAGSLGFYVPLFDLN